MKKLLGGTALAFLCVLGAGACTEACGCSPPPAEISGIIFGTVTAPDATPVANATVALTAGVGSCEVDGDVHVADGVTNESGAYEAYFEAYDLDGASVCVIARAYPPASSSLDPSPPIQLDYDDEDYNRSIVVEHDFVLGAGGLP